MTDQPPHASDTAPSAAAPAAITPRAGGVAAIAALVPNLPVTPGVYRMINAAGEVLYVGKAISLAKRVVAYTQFARLNPRLQRMVSETASLEFVTTRTEVEALLLEANLIKRLKPRYNILLRDDKSFPQILLTGDHPFPRVVKHRGAPPRNGDCFGPFASGWAVNKTLAALQRAFLLRSCADTVFEARTRPCLLYQIKRCAAPCVGRIDALAYAALVAEARAFLLGDSQRIQRDLAARMERASEALAFEDAAALRDRIRALTAVQSQQEINLRGLGDADVIAGHQAGGASCVEVFFFRGGCNYGNHAYFPAQAAGEALEAVLEAFVGQFYADRPPPPTVIVSAALPSAALIEQALSLAAGRKVRLIAPQRGTKRHLLDQALANARDALGRRLAESASQQRLLTALAETLGLDAAPARIEVYDNSHIAGQDAIGAMVVAGAEGLIRNAYRKFTIRGATIAAGDDYAMLREVLTRRFGRALALDPDRAGPGWPDLVLIDGGLGQLAAAREVFAELGLDDLAVAAIAKGPERNAGRERIFVADRPPLTLDPRDPVLYFLQRLRDEAHRFVIGSHRAKRSARISRSQIDEIPGIGAKRKKALLHHFGSLHAIMRAGCADLEAVPGINRAIAKKIYDWFRPQG